MKHYYTRTLMLLLALTWLVPKANAQYQYTSNNGYFSFNNGTWDNFVISGEGHSAMWFQGAVANGKIYSLPATMASTTFDTGETGVSLSYLINSTDDSGTTHRITRGLYFDFEQAGAEFFSCGNYSGYPVGSGSYWYAGPAIASDGAETLWMTTLRSSTAPSSGYDGSPWSAGIKSVAYYTKNNLPAPGVAGKRVGIDLSSYNIGRSDLMSAYGDGANGEGYLWFCDYTNNKIVRVKIVNGQAEGVTRFTPPVTINNARGRTLQYSDDRVIFSNGRDGDKKIYRGVINGSSITWYNLGVTTVGNNTAYGCPGATMFIMGGYEYLAYSSATNAFSINVYDASNPATTTTLDVSSNINAFSGSGSSWVNHNIQAVVAADKKSAELYVYTPQRGAFKRSLAALKTKAQDPVQNLAVEIVKDQDPSQLSRQDAILTWEAPAKGTVSKYTIYCRENPWFSMEGNGVDSDGDGYSDGPQWRQDTWSAWKAIGTTTELTFTDIDVCMYGSSIPRSYQYKVVPTFSTGTTGAESNVIEITPGFVPFVPVWDTTMDQDDIKLGIDRYDGYCKIQLYWTFPQVNNYDYFPSGQKNVYGVKPDYYSILRNGKEIATNITCYNYIDTDVKSEQRYTYEVVSHYYDFPNDTAVSSPNTVYVAKRDWAKVGYELTEIYNYKIAASGTNVHIPASSYSNITSTPGSYYQGAYHNGYWYIGQLNDGTSSTTSGGGIIKISAADPKDNANENILKPGTKYKSFSYWLTNGIASDDEGNLFVQSSTFGSRLKTGTIYMNNGSSYTVNLSGIDLTKYNERDPSKYLTTSSGRVDYYSMKGNLRTKGEAYLYLAPSISRAVFVVKLKYTGSAVTAELVNEFANTEGRRRWNNEPFLQNNENLAFPVRCTGRENEFLHLIRSSALVAMKQNNSSSYATPDSIIYDTQSRVNTPGGCTIEFNGELFLITPTSQYSVNKGNFYIGMAERKSSSDTPAQANWGHIIPVIQHQQADAEDGGGNASGTVSIFAEVGKEDVNGDKILNDYIDIYLYAPNGLRFAKYRLTPSNAFPPSQVTLDVKPVYAEERDAGINPGGDIERFDATATWSQVVDYGVTTEQGNIYYKISSYTLQLVDAAGNPISEKDEESGNLLFPAIEFDVNENHVPTAVYTVTFDANGNKTRIPVAEDSNLYKNLSWKANDEGVMIYSYVYKDVKKGFDYTALVTVNYLGNDQSNQGVSQKSQKTEYESSNTYEPEEATGVVLVDVKKGNWGDWNGNGKKDEGDAYYDNYRVCLKLANPDFGKGEVYPRSYYTIGIDKDKNGTIDQEVTNFHLYIGVGNSIETKAYKALATTSADIDGYIEITDGQISGDYDFDQSTNGKPHVYWDMKDYTAPASYNDGVTYTDSDNPSTWNYIVTTHYAAGNSRISEAVTSPMGANNGGITTGVEVISTQSVLNVYPIPATVSVTIKCSEAIENIEIYSTAGVMVKSIAGNGEQIETINVSDLAAGYYFMRVNNLAPVKIIKN